MKKIILFALLLMKSINYAYASQNSLDLALPIEINADNMMIDQQQAIAVLSGNVEANQGDINITSDIMKIYYRNNGKNLDNNSISKIEVEGNVYMKTKKESAKSQWGIYDLKDGIVTLSNRVTLMQDHNVIKGDKLIYNVKQGKSTISNDTKDSKKEDKKSSKRVKAVFKTDGLSSK